MRRQAHFAQSRADGAHDHPFRILTGDDEAADEDVLTRQDVEPSRDILQFAPEGAGEFRGFPVGSDRRGGETFRRPTVAKVTSKAAPPTPSVVTSVEPRKIWPSPHHAGCVGDVNSQLSGVQTHHPGDVGADEVGQPVALPIAVVFLLAD